MTKRYRSATMLLAFGSALLLLLSTACGSIGDIFGGGGDDGRQAEEITEVRGTVSRVDTANQFIELEGAEQRTNLRDDEGLSRLYFDRDTVVEHEGRRYGPEALERGDRIVAAVDDVGGRLVAGRIEVTFDVSGDRRDDDREDGYADLRGTVYQVDTRDRTVELDAVSYGNAFDRDDDRDDNRAVDRVTVHYDGDTVVEFDGRRYVPDNLERGDVVQIAARWVDRVLVAEQIEVVRDARARL
jgi:hypothetical protein